MLNLIQFKHLVRITLEAIELGGETAVNLVFGTAIQESSLKYIMQLGGPAVGICQCEPFTYADIKARLSFRPELQSRVLAYLNMPSLPEDATALMGNMTLSIIVARLKYYLIPEALPANDPVYLCAYYKKYYNTALGKANIDTALPNFKLACNIS